MLLKFLTTLYLISFSLSIFAQHSKGIFGRNDRVLEKNQTNGPYKMVGRLETEEGVCTAALIFGDLILTSAHCLFDDKGEKIKGDYEFFLGKEGEKSSAKSLIKETWWGNFTDDTQDWAILRLKDSLGDVFGWFELEGNKKLLGQDLNVIGYSSYFTNGGVATIHRKCQFIEFFSAGLFRHNCDVWGGDSGAPIYIEKSINGKIHYYIVGIHMSGYRQEMPEIPFDKSYYNDALHSAQFIRKFKELVK